jgi:hypothetical protein
MLPPERNKGEIPPFHEQNFDDTVIGLGPLELELSVGSVIHDKLREGDAPSISTVLTIFQYASG